MVKTNPDINFKFEFKGTPDFESVNNEVIRLNSMLENSSFDFIVVKRIYSISVELLYNVVYHGIKLNNSKNIDFSVNRVKNQLVLSCSNNISSNETQKLRAVIDNLNNTGFDELRKMKAHQIKNGGISEKGGAGLGLIDISMKSQNPVIPNFKLIDKQNDWLTLEVKVDLV